MEKKMSDEEIVVLPGDNEILSKEILANIMACDAFPVTTNFTKTIEYIAFEMYGKAFTQVVTTFKPDIPR